MSISRLQTWIGSSCFFPERRQFFLENGDQFTNFGYATIRPFFSRRIGLGGVPIRFGARLSGKLNKDWRIGLMDMQTGRVEDMGPNAAPLPMQNFAVMALQRRVFARSNVGVLLVNKQSLGYEPVLDKPAYSQYNRNVGFEYNLASANNLWTGKAMYIKSFQPGTRGNDAVYAGNLQYNSRRWLLGGQLEAVGKNFTAEAGYVPRRGYKRAQGTASYTFLPASGGIQSHGPLLHSTYFFDPAGRKSDNETYLSYLFTFRSRSTFTSWIATDYVRLLQPSTQPTPAAKRWRPALPTAGTLGHGLHVEAAEPVDLRVHEPLRRLLRQWHPPEPARRRRLSVSALRQPGCQYELQ
jgi:hypothetical protein